MTTVEIHLGGMKKEFLTEEVFRETDLTASELSFYGYDQDEHGKRKFVRLFPARCAMVLIHNGASEAHK